MSNVRYFDIQLTDISLHTQEVRKPDSFGRAISKTISNGQQGRAFMTRDNIKLDESTGKMTFTIPFGPEIAQAVEKANKQGMTIRIIMPNGTPFLLGEDTIERLKKIQKKSV
jgi:hypothetical protein